MKTVLFALSILGIYVAFCLGYVGVWWWWILMIVSLIVAIVVFRTSSGGFGDTGIDENWTY